MLPVVGLLLAADVASAGPTPPDPRPNVIVITFDAMRPDRMGLYGHEAKNTPTFEALAEESVVFTHCYATGAWTSPGIASLLTGYYPGTHGQISNKSWYDATSPAALRTLRQAGYAVVGRSNDEPTYQDYGIGSELGDYGDIDKMLERLSERDGPFFTWIHVKQTHLPYHPSEEHRLAFAGDVPQSPGMEAVQKFGVIFKDPQEVAFPHAEAVPFTEADKAAVPRLYDAAVADADTWLAGRLEHLQTLGILDRSVLVLSADHGEELFDHGWIGHASTSYVGMLYDEVLRIPLVVRLPGGAVHGRVDALVQQVDVLPTVFEIAGIDAAGLEPAMQGRSLLPLMHGGTEAVHPIGFADTTRKGWTTPEAEIPNRLSTAFDLDLKLVRSGRGDDATWQAFSRATDPDELQDLWATDAARFEPLRVALLEHDAEMLEARALLRMPAARARVQQLEDAATAGNASALAAAWVDFVRLRSTEMLDPEPFFADARFAAEWKSLEKRALRAIRKGAR